MATPRTRARDADRTAAVDTITLAVGAERLLQAGDLLVPLRAGFTWEPQGGRDPVTRSTVEFFVLTLGAGVNTNAVKFDVAVQHRFGTWDASQAVSIASLASGGVDVIGRNGDSQWLVKASVIYQLPERE